ncbi:MAG: response regulator transcription factor [Dehalococcoidia bacterium]
MPRLVLIDTDEAERQHIAAALTSAGFEALEASGSVEGLLLVLDSSPDLIVIAEEMPPLEAGDILQILRRASDAPIIVIGSGGEPDEVAILESGADSYMRKGASLRLLTARFNALLRRYPHRPNSAISRWPSLMPIPLTATETRLLSCLSNHNGRPISIEELRAEVWGGSAGVDTVKHYLRRLRHKMKSGQSDFELLCIRGVGYRVVPTGSQSPARGDDDSGLVAPGHGSEQAGVA